MSVPQGPYCFEQLHIDVARNTTDDFNPFHDPKRWLRIRNNPFGSTIVLGFQTEFLVSDLVSRKRRREGGGVLSDSLGLNFVLAGLGTQQDYFDELDEFVSFPPVFTAALLSCGLLEKAWQEGYDFEADPVVYTTHQISVDKRLQRALRGNDCLHLLIEGPLEAPAGSGLGNSGMDQQLYHVFGVVMGPAILFRAKVQMAALHTMLAAAV